MATLEKAYAKNRSLDEWYRTINRIYIDRNFYRDTDSIFGHLVEVVGGLSLLGSEKQKIGINPEAFMSKAIAWWFALCGKMGVRSVEAMLWAKFPYACPYCQKCAHENDPCIEAKKLSKGADWKALEERGKINIIRKPKNLAAWQSMFYDIYPTPTDPTFTKPLMRFSEELGELAESIRIAQIAPGYFLSEASDVFAWLMNLQNVLHSKRGYPNKERGFALVESFRSSYPDVCNDCGKPICSCPPILPGTLGRIAHEIPSEVIGFTHSGVFMSSEEAQDYFELGATSIVVGSETIQTEFKLIRDIHKVVSELRIFAISNRTIADERSVQLATALASIETLTSTQRITQESIDELGTAIASLPSEGRTALVGYLTGMASSTWAPLLIDLITKIVK